VVNAVLQISGGTLLAGTDGGISRLDLTGSGSIFRTIPSDALSKQLDLERLRTRIAADLHDDLGTSLSRVAIMSETVRLEMDRSPEESRERLSEIAATARNLVDGMSDLVWYINPRKDDMRSLLRRVREFASGVLEAEGIDWTLEIQSGVDDLILNAEQRRHLFLILKEAIANAAKHARCSSVGIDARVGGSRFEVSIADNGRGMREETPGDGNGLRNMRRRAEALGGSLSMDCVAVPVSPPVTWTPPHLALMGGLFGISPIQYCVLALKA
jgi:signal transduction histidine kinase